MRLPFLQFYFLLLCNVISIAQTNIKTYEGHWEGELKNQHVFNFDITLKVLDNEKYVAIGNPVLVNDSSNSVIPLSSSQIFCVLVSCQTNALYNGCAVDFLQANVVSL